MAGFGLGKGGVMTDSSFIYIEWLGKDSPKHNREIKDLIEYLDEEQFLDTTTIEDSLPYLTFFQAEELFKALKEQFGDFTLAKVSLANNDSGKPSIEDEPAISPFTIDHHYDNLISPLMEASLCDSRFKAYSYDELALYFTDNEHGILKIYAESLGLSRSELPYFPLESDVPNALKRATVQKTKTRRGYSQMEAYENSLFNKITLGVAIVGVLFGILGVVIGVIGNSKKTELETKVAYLYQQQQQIQTVQEKSNAADVFGRFFIPNYYSGNKEALNPFLSKGDAKYTQPEQAKVISNLLESVKLADDGSFTLTYVVTFSTANEETKTKRLSFGVKEDKKASYGFLVVSEPVTNLYLSEKTDEQENQAKGEETTDKAEKPNTENKEASSSSEEGK